MLRVEIHLEGHLDQVWADWLDGFTLDHTQEGETILVGKIKDQAAFYGLIAKLRDLGLKLLSVNIGRQKNGNLTFDLDDHWVPPDGNE